MERAPPNFNANSIEELTEQASKEGYAVVDSSDIKPLLKEFDRVVPQARNLIDTSDPVKTPYKSKYEARTLLDELVKNLEANKTIMQLEGKKDSITKDLNPRIAKVRLLLGHIAWDVEEPHNAEIDLELAAEILFPGLCEHIKKITKGIGDDEVEDSSSVSQLPSDAALDPETLALLEPTDRITSTTPKDSAALKLKNTDVDGPTAVLVDSIKCLNLMGILWSGRGCVERGALYLHCVHHIYERLSSESDQGSAGSWGGWLQRGGKVWAAVEDVYTHTLFYLAQAHGNLGDAQVGCKEGVMGFSFSKHEGTV